jgi:hypothetical protein
MDWGVCGRPVERKVSMGKIFVRHRRHVGPGAGRPRFAIVGAHDTGLTLYRTRVRRAELEKIASEIGADIVYLPRGEYAEAPEPEGGKGRRHRRERAED